jgi:hypothetical protein
LFNAGARVVACGSLAMFAAIRRASSLLSSLVDSAQRLKSDHFWSVYEVDGGPAVAEAGGGAARNWIPQFF